MAHNPDRRLFQQWSYKVRLYLLFILFIFMVSGKRCPTLSSQLSCETMKDATFLFRSSSFSFICVPLWWLQVMEVDQRSGDSGAEGLEEEEEEETTESLVCTVLSALQNLGQRHHTSPNVSFGHTPTLFCLHGHRVIPVPSLRLLQGQSWTRRRGWWSPSRLFTSCWLGMICWVHSSTCRCTAHLWTSA